MNQPNIVTIYDIGSADSVSSIAMEKVDGKTLREVLFSGPVPVKRLLQVATQIADGLARAHEAGIGDKLRLGSVDLVFRAFPLSGSTGTVERK